MALHILVKLQTTDAINVSKTDVPSYPQLVIVFALPEQACLDRFRDFQIS